MTFGSTSNALRDLVDEGIVTMDEIAQVLSKEGREGLKEVDR